MFVDDTHEQCAAALGRGVTVSHDHNGVQERKARRSRE